MPMPASPLGCCRAGMHILWRVASLPSAHGGTSGTALLHVAHCVWQHEMLPSATSWSGHVCHHRHAPQMPWSEFKDHARYRYLLHLDGASASYRLGLLMSTDSLVLEQRSPYVEYFTRWAGGGGGGARGRVCCTVT